jgi:hypothetical protein
MDSFKTKKPDGPEKSWLSVPPAVGSTLSERPFRVSGVPEAKRHLIEALKGKKVVLVVDDNDYAFEASIFKFAILSEVQASESSEVIRYSDFLSGNDRSAGKLSADVLLLRSSRLFIPEIDEVARLAQSASPDFSVSAQSAVSEGIKKVMAAVRSFKDGNPGSAVIVCAYMKATSDAFRPIADARTEIWVNPPVGDFILLEKAAEMLGLIHPA